MLTQEYRIAGANRRAAYNEYSQTIITGFSEVNTQYNNIRALQEVINYEQVQVEELKSATGIAGDLFMTGFANYLEVLMVRRNLLNAELDLLETQKLFFHAYMNLYKVLGGGWE